LDAPKLSCPWHSRRQAVLDTTTDDLKKILPNVGDNLRKFYGDMLVVDIQRLSLIVETGQIRCRDVSHSVSTMKTVGMSIDEFNEESCKKRGPNKGGTTTSWDGEME
jgi:hypothetical protein